MLKSDETRYSDEQYRSLKHFNELSDYWYEIYQDESSFAGYTLRKQHHFVLDFVERTESAKHILDVGCGAGVTALELAHRGYQVSGLDIAPNMIQKAQSEAQRRHLGCEFKVGVAEKLPYPDQHFDIIIALGLLGNIRDDMPVIIDMARVLKPGGHLILSMPNLLALDLLVALPRSLPIMLGATRFRHPLRVIGNLGRRLIRRNVKAISTLRFNHCVTPPKFVGRLQQHGFNKVSYYPLTFGPLMPFGLRLVNDAVSIYISEQMVAWVTNIQLFRWGGTLIVYEAQKSG
jgi:ubiquinone/menaquinone biosynthesis C-methylase UbiE